MTENNPLLDRSSLEKSFSYNPETVSLNLPNVPFKGIDTTLPQVDGEITPSALSAIENKLLTPKKGDDKLMGGSIPRTIYDVTSSRYNAYVPGDYNNEDAYAQGQGWPSKMINGVGKGLLLTGTTFLQSTAGLVNGVARWMDTGRFASLYDNDFNKYLDELNKEAEDVLPNYYTDVEKNSRWYAPSKLFSANFLWDGVVKNLGFAAGAAASGAVYASALKALPLTSRLFSVGKGAEALAATEEGLLAANKSAEVYGKIRSLSDKFLSSYRVTNPAGRAVIAGLATTGEAGFEAFHNLNEFREKKIQEYRDSHAGQDPVGEELEKINRLSDEVGNSSFFLNTALLTATNYIQFPKILGSSYRAEKGILNKETRNIVKDTTGKFVEELPLTKRGRILASINKVRPYTFSTSEAFEEGAQYAITVGTQDYYNKKYDGEITNLLDSLVYGAGKTLSTDEGMENVLIGGLSGAIMMGRGRFLEQAAISKNTAEALKAFNQWKISDFTKETIDSVVRGTILQEEREAAIRRGEILESKDKEADYVINYLTPRVKYGRLDLIKADIAEYRQLASTDEGFSQLQSEGKAYPTDTKESYIKRLDNLENTAENINSLYQSLQLRYGNLINSKNEPVYSEDVMNKMIYAATKIADYDSRLPLLQMSLVEKGILFEGVTEKNKVNDEVLNTVIEQINSLNTTSDIKDELKSSLEDYIELSLRRDSFIKEYDKIKNSPEKYKEQEFDTVEENNKKLTVKQEVLEGDFTKTINKELEVGKEYSLSQIIRRVGNTLEVLPKIKILSKTLGGEITTKLPSGKIAYLSPEQFKQFALQDDIVDLPNIENIVDSAIDKVLNKKEYENVPKPSLNKLAYVNSLNNSDIISDIEKEISKSIDELEEQKKQQIQLNKNKELKEELIKSADEGIQTVISEKEFEPDRKKDAIQVITSTKAPSTSDLPHHTRSNIFGANLPNFENRESIKGAVVTKATESQLGLAGLSDYLKGESDVDASKIISIVMVEEDKLGRFIPVDVNGKPLTSASIETAIFQVMPDPSLSWSKEFGGGSMFRKETTKEQEEFYKKQYSDWANSVLSENTVKSYNITPSLGIPEYVTYLDEKGNSKRDYNARISVEQAGLIKKSQLIENQLIYIPTQEDVGPTSFKNALGRPFLKLPNGYISLQNRKLTEKEANTVYSAILQLSKNAAKDKNIKSDESVRLINWLRTIVYWGSPKNDIGRNSIFFNATDSSLVISSAQKTYPFTPSSLEANKDQILADIKNLYNNINSKLTGNINFFNEEYEEIVEILPDGKIESKIWKNYQTYLLSSEGRKPEELPLFTQIKPISEGETNRKGIYFTLSIDVESYKEQKKESSLKKMMASAKTEAPSKYTLDGKTINTYTSPQGKKIQFIATSREDIKVVKGGDLDTVLKELTEKVGDVKAKENIKNAIKASLPEVSQPEVSEEVSTALFNRLKKGSKGVFTDISSADEEIMRAQMSDLEDDTPLRVRIENDPVITENWDTVQKWLEKNLPNIPLYRVKNIIETLNGAQAWGMFKDSSIYLYENAEVGTVYHEAFEAVWKLFSTPEERINLIQEFKNRKGSFIDRPTGRTISYSEATDFEIKEQLAEEFRDFVLSEKKEKSKISQFFSDLLNFIKSFFVGNTAVQNSKELFNRISTGYYKTYIPDSQKLSLAKNGIVDIEQAFASNDSEFRIKNIPADVVHDIMQQMTYIALTDLIKTNKSLFGLPKINKTVLYSKLKEDLQKTALKSRKAAEELIESGKFTEEQALPIIEKSVNLWKNITDEWEEIVKKHQEYLKVYSIEFDENDDVVLKDEDASKKGDYQEATKIDVFKKANSAVKLLLSTIPMVNQEGKLIYSSINGAKLLPTSQVFMAVMNKVHTSRNINEMLDRIKEMSEDDFNYKTLYNRLTKGTSDLSEIKEVHDGQLLAAFWRTFKKQSPDVKNVYIFENGDVEIGDSNLSSAARQISSDYTNAIVKTIKSQNPYFEYSPKERAFIGKPSGVKSVRLDNDERRVAFLKTLGIDFTAQELKKLSSDKLDNFREAVAGIKNSIEKADKIATVSRKILDIKGRLMQLSLIRATLDNPEFDSTFFNVKGERTQTFIGTNPASDLYDYISQINNKEELRNTPYEYLLNDSFSKNSVILDKMFNPETGNRIKGSEQLMKPGYADGTINLDNGKKKQSSKLTYKERIIQEMNLNLAGYYYNLVPGDASMEWMVYMGNHISPSSLISNRTKFYDIFKGYFVSELELSREERPVAKKRKSNNLRFFESILGKELNDSIIKEQGTPEEVYSKYQDKINKSLDSFVENQSKLTKETLESYGIVKVSPEGYAIENLSFGDNVSESELNRNIDALTMNFMINNIELHKLLYSDPYQYSDELKRIKNANSPRQAILNNSSEINAALNNIWNKDYSEEDIGYTDMTKDYFRTVTLEDVVSTSDLKDYGTFEETDGGGIISMKAYRLFRIKAGEWNEDEELQYKYDIAFEKNVKDIPLSADEERLLEEGNPAIKSAYTPIKPIVFGNKANGQTYNSVLLDKFALYPLSFRIAYELNPESNAVKHYNKLQKENIDYSVFGTGRKVGSEGTYSLYNEDGSFNDSPYSSIINVPHNIISIQSEVPSKDEPVVSRGTQITKLATLDYMEAGIPIDFQQDKPFQQRFIMWNALSETEKIKSSNLYKEIKYNQELLEQMTKNGYETLLNRLGIKQTEDGNFVIEDFTKVADTLKDEILKREVNDNIVDAFEGFKNGDVVLEATPAYQQIRNILYSIADKTAISPKISGGMKVQIPSTLLETVRAKKEKGAYTSDVLSFYEDMDGKRICEIMVGRWFESDLSDNELIEYLNNTEQGKKILEGIGYRIPTQKQNSIDAFRIKQFLPKEFGDSVVIPSALVKKVGSDFDIDKLSIYLKNTYIDLKGKLKLVPFYGYGEKAKQKFSEMYDNGEFLNSEDRKTVNKWIENRKIEDRDNASEALFKAIFGESSFEDTYIQETMDDFMASEDVHELKSKIVAEKYKQSLENEYIQSLQNLVSHPLNFENLIKPNSADQLKALSEEIVEKLGQTKFDYSSVGNMLSRDFMSKLRHAFVSGKYAIGIAAVNQTNHSLNQRQPIYIDNERFDKVEPDDLFWLTGGTLRKEDISIKFSKYNTIEIDERKVPTLSMIKNAEGENISDIIGQFIDGYVDISKGPWIMELGAAPNVASTWLFLVKLGVPINDVAYFMNQPIVRDYLRTIENAGYSWLFIDSIFDETNAIYDPRKNVDYSKMTLSSTKLKSLLGKSVNKMSSDEKAYQLFVLGEFLKYSKMANQLFLVTQGSNWDTATFNDPYLVFKKNEQYKKAQSTIISSIDSLVRNSFIGNLSETIYNIRDAFSTILISDQDNVRDVLQDVLRPYVDMTDREFIKISQKVVSDLFDWTVQVDRKLNTQIQNILLSDENVAKQVSDFVVEVRKNPKHPLFNNQVIKLVTPHFSERVGGVNNLKIKNKENKVYDQNQLIYAFEELKSFLNGQDNPLYGNIVRLAVLQSGLSNSPISFTTVLPYEDFKEVYNKTLSVINEMPNLHLFKELNIFERNNWNNADLVPYRKARWKQNKNGEWKYNNNMKFFGYNRVSQAIDNEIIPQLVKINSMSRESKNDVIVYSWEEGTKAEKEAKKKKGDYSYIKKGLFKKVYKGNDPFTVEFSIGNKVITDYVYKMINAWGDSHSSDGIYFSANEFYEEGKPSIIENGFLKVENEVSDDTIIDFFEKPSKSTSKSKEQEDSSNTNIPECA